MKIVVKIGGATLEDAALLAARGAGGKTTRRPASGSRGAWRRRCPYPHAGPDGQAE